MRRSILILGYVLTLSLTKLSFAELVPEQWCSKCPPGADLTLLERDRYDCRVAGTNQSAGAPLWAKPSWAKVIWDVQEGRCIDSYIRFGDKFCYRCPVDYELNTAVTYYREQSGNSCKRIIGHWKRSKGRFIDFSENNKWTSSEGNTGQWQCNHDGSVDIISDTNPSQLTVTVAISHDGSSFSGNNQYGVSFHATRSTPGRR